MNDKNTDFPVYRMMSGRKVYYEIHSDRLFTEYSWIGVKLIRFEMEAKQYPEILRIQDMIQCVEPFVAISKEMFEKITN